MKELDPWVLMAIFQEMLGIWLWVLLAIVILVTAAFVGLLLRERGVIARRLIRSQALGLLGGALALLVMAEVSSSGFTDAAGPADWIVIAGVFILGTIGSTILLYTLAGWHNAGQPAPRHATHLQN